MTKARGQMPKGQMNKTEARYADLLELRKRTGEIRHYEFEAVKFRIGSKCFYTPDFMVVMADWTVEFHEVKGFWRDDARVKIKAVAAQYGYFKFKAVRWIKKQWDVEEM